MSTQPPKLLDQVRHACRRRGYSYRTEQAYTSWTRRYVRFHDTTHPRDLDADDVRAFLNHLATERDVAASTQKQALNALFFLYQQVLHLDLDDLGTIERAKPPRRLPTVLSRADVRHLLSAMSGTNRLVACLLYGSGLRLSEALRLRVKDVRFDRDELTVRDGKGRKDRRTMLPTRLQAPLRRHLRQVKVIHEGDTAEEFRVPGSEFGVSSSGFRDHAPRLHASRTNPQRTTHNAPRITHHVSPPRGFRHSDRL